MVLLVDPKELYTAETIVFKDGFEKVDVKKPILILRDPHGKLVVTDGNHRAKKALLEGKQLPAEVIGELVGNVEDDPDFRKIDDLQIKVRTEA